MRTQLVTIQTDTIPIDGALHEPDGPAKGAALYFHGNPMNFFTGAARFLAPVLTKLGLAFLAFNRRGHDILTTRLSRAAEGGAFQTSAEAIADNRFAAQWLAARGFPSPVIMGHSNGGMLSTRHVVDHPNTPALVLLSAGRGGGARETSGGCRQSFFRAMPRRARISKSCNHGPQQRRHALHASCCRSSKHARVESMPPLL